MASGIDDITKMMITKVIIIIVVIVLAYLMVLQPVLRKLGILETKESKERDKLVKELGTSTESPFSPSYYQKYGGTLVTKAKAKELAKLIYDAMGVFNDKETQVYGALRQLKYKSQLSWVADVFQQEYQMDLYQYIASYFNDSEMDIVHGIATNLQ